MFRVLFLCLALLALASPSRASTVIACQDANGSDWPVSPQHPCPTTVPTVTGFGTLAATAASALVSTMTLGPNSAAWPATPGMVYVMNASSSAGALYVCPLGGTCSAANGIPLAAGTAYGFFGPATTMTVIAASTATAVFQF